ncbi:MAG: hypothetical protein EOO09_09790 [Chitinophagaceae bacterium]|nr:MAG: hypothetical protein EOO09_09790 [Chitinophagaceae bacterium]
MKYQLGDTVLIMHSNEEGRIVDFINEKMAMVEVRGVKFPVHFDQIDFPYFKRFSEKKLVPAKKEKKYIDDVKREKYVPVEKVVDGVWLTMLPVFANDEFGDELVDRLKIHLVNRTTQPYHFTYLLNLAGKNNFELKNVILPFQDFYIHDMDFENVNDSPAFEFEFSLTEPSKKKAEYFESILKLKPKQLFNKIQEIKEKNQPTFSFNIFKEYPDKVVPDYVDTSKLSAKGYKVYNAKEARQHLEAARSVVDLHAEKLTDEWQKMDNFEILTLQLKTFEKFYDLAIAHVQPSLTVVHGLGSGKLKDEIHEILKTKREVKSFVNQYDSRFGYGATEIFFQY